jgi:hypothetical protein
VPTLTLETDSPAFHRLLKKISELMNRQPAALLSLSLST